MALRPAVFLDRDGTILVERSYLADPEGVELVPGSAAALADLQAAGLALVVVTNQSGIARGLYTEADYDAVSAKLESVLGEVGVRIDATEHCPHHVDFTGPCTCRKPGTGMHRRAAERLGIDLARSWYVGDKVADVRPALELGGQGILVRTGYGREQEAGAPEGIRIVEDLRAAADLVLASRGPDQRR